MQALDARLQFDLTAEFEQRYTETKDKDNK